MRSGRSVEHEARPSECGVRNAVSGRPHASRPADRLLPRRDVHFALEGCTLHSRMTVGTALSSAKCTSRRRGRPGAVAATRAAHPGGRSDAVCPNLLQRPGSSRSAGRETLIFRVFVRGLSRSGAPLQQIWTRPRPGPSQEPHPHHPAPACPRHRADPGPGTVVPGEKGSFRFRGSSIRWFFGGSADPRGSLCSKSLELRPFHHAQKALSAGEPEFAVGPGAEATHADALADLGPVLRVAVSRVVVNGGQNHDPLIAGLLQSHTQTPGIMSRHDAPLDRTQPYLSHIRSIPASASRRL